MEVHHMSEQETLLVIAKVKNYVKAQGDLKSSKDALDKLNGKIINILDAAITNARNDKNKTLLAKHLD